MPSEVLQLLELPLLLGLLLATLLFLEEAALVGALVRLPVLPLDESTALLALVSLSATVFNVADPDVDLEDLFAVGTRPRLHVALFFVITELVRRGLEIAVLTLD